MVAFVSLATHRRWRQILPVGALAIGMAAWSTPPSSRRSATRWYVSLSFSVAFTGVLLAIGMYIGARRELMASLQDRAERAEREQALRVAQAQANERARIAREMHDVLAHRMSLVAMHAGRARLPRPTCRRRRPARPRRSSRQRHRHWPTCARCSGCCATPTAADGEPPERPQPTLCDVPGLVEEARAAGTRVTLSDERPRAAAGCPRRSAATRTG